MGLKVTIDLQTGRIVVEGEEGNLLGLAKAVQDLMPSFEEVVIIRRPPGYVPPPLTGVTGVPPPGVDAAPPPAPPGTGVRDLGPREFAKKFGVTTVFDRATVLTYYACKIKQMPYVSAGEIGDWFGLCGWSKPANTAVALSDTSRRKLTIDSKGRDKWVVTTIGENFVIELMEKTQGG